MLNGIFYMNTFQQEKKCILLKIYRILNLYDNSIMSSNTGINLNTSFETDFNYSTAGFSVF